MKLMSTADNRQCANNGSTSPLVKTTRKHLRESVESVGEAGGLYGIELSVKLLSYCTACRE